MRITVLTSQTETKIAQIKVTSGKSGYELNFVHEEEMGADGKNALAAEFRKLAEWMETHP